MSVYNLLEVYIGDSKIYSYEGGDLFLEHVVTIKLRDGDTKQATEIVIEKDKDTKRLSVRIK